MSAVKDAVVMRFRNICKEREIATNELSNISGVTPSTVYSLFDEKRHDVSITTIIILQQLPVYLLRLLPSESPNCLHLLNRHISKQHPLALLYFLSNE